MANLQLIKTLAEEKNISLEQLAKELEITPQALSKIMRINSTKIDTLERIAAILKVSPTVFFTEKDGKQHSVSAGNNGIAVSGKQIKVNGETAQFLALLQEKEKQINRLLGMIEELTRR